MPLRAIIVDDEQKGIDALRILVERFLDDVKIVASTTKASDAIGLIGDYMPEIVFLDINMPEMDGFELLGKLKERNFSLVFTTAHQEYGLRALRSDAVDYLLKPVDYEDLRFAINKIKNRLADDRSATVDYGRLLTHIYPDAKHKLAISSRNGIESISLDDILSLEARSNYTLIYQDELPVILASKTLKEFEDILCYPDSRFIRVHNSFIVNLQKIVRFTKVTDTIIMSSRQEIPLSKSRKEAFLARLGL